MMMHGTWVYADDCEGSSPTIPGADLCDDAGEPILQNLLTNTLINAEILLHHDESSALETNLAMIGVYTRQINMYI